MVNTMASSPIRVFREKGYPIPVTIYDSALNNAAYGNTQLLGDFFGDVMGAVIGKDNWDARPQWMKNIKVKPDPTALIKAVPPKYVGTVARQAQQYGVNVYNRTPYGDVQITPGMMESAYSNFPAFSRAVQGISSIPAWAWLAGGAGIILLVFAAKK
jgi:hypothetical protein